MVGVQVILNMAEMDMVYSQHALLRLVAFLDKAYPPPSLDPLMIRTAVTLNEIVRERLINKKSSSLVNHHQYQNSIRVSFISEPPSFTI